MVTSVGTGSNAEVIIKDLILLERDAIAAYETTIERLEDPGSKAKIGEFRQDHLRHLDELMTAAPMHGLTNPPAEGDMKQMLTTGKVKLADMMGGDGAILKAMSSNENDTIAAYRNASENKDAPSDLKTFFASALADEERHKVWMDAAARTALPSGARPRPGPLRRP